jgi:hypothetical protein
VVASIVYVLLCALRRIDLAHTQLAATIRLKLLKIGALVKISARRVCGAGSDRGAEGRFEDVERCFCKGSGRAELRAGLPRGPANPYCRALPREGCPGLFVGERL